MAGLEEATKYNFGREASQLAGHNMVCDRINDEIQGTVGGKKKGEHTKLVDTIREIEQLLQTEDAYRTIHGAEA
eukprot:3204730-Prymnesium_polylepis.1